MCPAKVRYPAREIYLSQTAANRTETHLVPNLSGSLGTDIVFLGFPLTPTDALAATPAWSL